MLIGESESLLRRLNEYVKPRTPEEGRWNLKFHNELGSGFRIECHRLEVEPFRIKGVQLDSNALGDPFVRRLLENVMLIMQPKDRCLIMNKGKKLQEKNVDKWVKKLKKLGATVDQLQGALASDKSK